MSTATRHVRREAKQLFRFCLVNGMLDEGRVRKVVQQILLLRRRGYLPLLGEMERLVRLDHTQHTAEVQSAVPLTADLRANVRARLEGAYGAGIDVLFAQEPALVGGMRVRVGSDVYDGSVRYRLSTIAKCFGADGAKKVQ
jgi:F-type H+-transporting ATPase subunit delta